MSESKEVSVQSYVQNVNVISRVENLLKDRTPQFITSLLSLVNSNEQLSRCNPQSVLNAAMTAASLNLPINSNLGFAYVIPYKDKAQFQMGYKGFIQLAQRSGQYKTIAATEVYEGQLVDENPLYGNTYDWSAKKSNKVIGYVALFVLLNGFEKTLYMTKDEMEKHAKEYSQSYKNNKGFWMEDFNAMAKKTVIKLLLSKFGQLSTEMQKAIKYDQAVINDSIDDIDYVDNDRLAEELADDNKIKAILEAHKENDKDS